MSIIQNTEIVVQEILNLYNHYLHNNLFPYWLVSHIYDNDYIININIENNTKIKLKENTSEHKFENEFLFSDDTKIIQKCKKYLEQINQIEDITFKYNSIMSILNNKNDIIWQDSFHNNKNNEIKKNETNDHLSHKLTNVFQKNYLNILIIGAGPCGLYFANVLKHIYGDKVIILIIDNRISSNGYKEPYSRQWLTNLPLNIFQGFNNIKNILEGLGENNYMGCTLNIFELLLYLSCRSNNIKFLFKRDYNLDFVANNTISFVFDATGNRLSTPKHDIINNNATDPNIKIIDNIFNNMDLMNITHYMNNYIPKVDKNNIKIQNKNTVISPLYKNNATSWYILKITNIPIQYKKNIEDLIKILNINDNKFFYWKGHLKESINKSLIFINLTQNEGQLFSQMIDEYHIIQNNKLNYIPINSIKMSGFYNKISPKITSLINYLLYIFPNNNILIERPFLFKLYFQLNPLTQISGRQLIKIGDSVFNGDAKLGNGLGSHIKIINSICNIFEKNTKYI